MSKKIALIRKNGQVDVYQTHHNRHWGHTWYNAVPDVETITPQSKTSPTGIRISMVLISLLLALVLLY